jgi:hypothetical protein
VKENEKLYRNIDDEDEKYKCPDNFAPVFFEEALASMDPELRLEAENVCGDDITCLFDIAATKQLSVGQSTLAESTEIKNDIAIVGKKYSSLAVCYVVKLNVKFMLERKLCICMIAVNVSNFTILSKFLIIFFLAKSLSGITEKRMLTFLENNIPVFLQNISVIRIVLGETFTLALEAADADGDEMRFDIPSIPPGASFNSSGNVLFFTWNVESADEVM